MCSDIIAGPRLRGSFSEPATTEPDATKPSKIYPQTTEPGFSFLVSTIDSGHQDVAMILQIDNDQQAMLVIQLNERTATTTLGELAADHKIRLPARLKDTPVVSGGQQDPGKALIITRGRYEPWEEVFVPSMEVGPFIIYDGSHDSIALSEMGIGHHPDLSHMLVIHGYDSISFSELGNALKEYSLDIIVAPDADVAFDYVFHAPELAGGKASLEETAESRWGLITSECVDQTIPVIRPTLTGATAQRYVM